MTSPPVGNTKGVSLFIGGSPDVDESTTLYIGPVASPSEEMTLFMPAPPFGEMPLFITTVENPVSGTPSLFMIGETSFGGTPYQGSMSLAFNAQTFVGTGINETWTLNISAPDVTEVVDNTNLFVGAPTDSDSSGTLRFFTSGATPTSANPERAAGDMSLYVRNRDSSNENATLKINTDFNKGQTTSLFISSRAASGDFTIFMDGKFISTESPTLFVKGPTNIENTLFLVGYQSNN